MRDRLPQTLQVGNDVYVKRAVREYIVSEKALELIQSMGLFMHVHTQTSSALGLNCSVGYLFTEGADRRLHEVTDEPYWAEALKEVENVRKKLVHLKDTGEQINFTIHKDKAHSDFLREQVKGFHAEFTKMHEKGHAISNDWFKYDKVDAKKRSIGPGGNGLRTICKPFVTDYEAMYAKTHPSSTNRNYLKEFCADYYAVSGFYLKDDARREYINTEMLRGRPYYKVLVDCIVSQALTWDRLAKRMNVAISKFEMDHHLGRFAPKAKKIKPHMKGEDKKKEKRFKLKRPKN